MLSWPMIAFGWVTNMLQRGLASWKRMLEVLDAEPGIADPPADRLVTLPAVARRHRVPRPVVRLRRPAGARRRVGARSRPGQTVALVGPTGSGKSTLITLLPRLLDPPPGTVFIDGVDVRDLPLAQLRGAIGFVPQEPFLFSETIADNIAFGVGGAKAADPERIRWAAAVARLDKDVAAFPNGFDTMVGERGITLSGGQKQRTAIARALLTDPRILVLDDALSAVDTYTEEEILRAAARRDARSGRRSSCRTASRPCATRT